MVGKIEMSFPVQGSDFTTAGEASSKIKRILQQVGLPSDITRRVAIAAYEAEMNIVIHANAGRLVLAVDDSQVTIIADDNGPGIENIDLAMQEGYSTASDEIREMGFGAGMGLPNMKRNSDEMIIDTIVGQGTKVTMKFNY